MANKLYKDDGVDVDVGDNFSKHCGRICRDTYANSPFVEVTDLSQGNFRGPRGFRLKNLPEGTIQTLAADGIGTKATIIVASGQLKAAASNVFAMTAMDITRWGGIPLVFANILDVSSLGEIDSDTYRYCMGLMDGMDAIARMHQYVVLTGESAELGVCVGSDDPNAKLKFNWGGFMLGAYHPKKMILGDTLGPGQVLVALRDSFRSNGLSSVRKAFRIRYGSEWFSNPAARTDLIAAASESAQYDRALNFVHGWLREGDEKLSPIINMHLVVHLSGGAFESKLGKDILRPLRLSATFDNLFDPPQIMRDCADWRGLSDRDCYSAWNGGQGALVVVEPEDADRLIMFMATYGIDARVAGKITPYAGYDVQIVSKFRQGIPIIY